VFPKIYTPAEKVFPKYTCKNKQTDIEVFRGLGEEALLACMLVDVGCGNVPFFAGFGGNDVACKGVCLLD
jgi:hypothetical protein